jgi:dihydrofolate reductase
MGKLTVTTFVTLDGVMQAPGGPAEDTSGGFRHGGWVVPLADQKMGAFIFDVFSRADAFLLGRMTYDIFAGHWPKVKDPDDLVAHKLNTLPKYIASHSRQQFDWEPSHAVHSVLDVVPRLKQQYAGEIQVHGSGALVQALFACDLVDELNLLTFPVLLGQGKRLFSANTPLRTMKLKHCEATDGGAVIAVYARGGALATGDATGQSTKAVFESSGG